MSVLEKWASVDQSEMILLLKEIIVGSFLMQFGIVFLTSVVLIELGSQIDRRK